MVNLKSAKSIVKYFLELDPELRDSDNRLIANVWARQLGGSEALANMTAFAVLKAFADGELLSPESIRRTRQKLQELNPELRGKTYEVRHEKEKDIRAEIRNY